ncbi:putative GTP binding domain, Beta-grasp domain superfamily [Helianthus annuus]|nr:putative GTP binding domain, Beta-grasp domain superfamily [Helianthus annuus]
MSVASDFHMYVYLRFLILFIQEFSLKSLRIVIFLYLRKSTLFNTLTKLSIPVENFPFCTIEPNEARVNIPDERFESLCQLFKQKS